MNPNEKILEIDAIPQQKEHWCYAAIVEMLIHYYNKLNKTTGGNKFTKKRTMRKKRKMNKKHNLTKKNKKGGTKEINKSEIKTQRKSKRKRQDKSEEIIAVSNKFTPAVINETYKNEQEAIALSVCNGNVDQIEDDQDPYDYLNNLGIIDNCHNKPPSWNEVVTNINNDNPLIVLIGPAKNAHYLLLIGYSGNSANDPNRHFTYIDPYSAQQIHQRKREPIVLKYNENEPASENAIRGYCTTNNPNMTINI